MNPVQPTPVQPAAMQITVLLKHLPGLDLEAVQSRMKQSDWWESFPPEGVRIVSWTVAMGLGQILVLELPPVLLQPLNVELERRAWRVFSTECHPSYDFLPVRERIRQRVRAGGQ